MNVFRWFEIRLCLLACKIALGLPPPIDGRIPMSGEKATSTDCMVACICGPSNKREYMVDHVEDKNVFAKRWDEERREYGQPAILHESLLKNRSVEVTHYFRGYKTVYHSALNVVVSEFIKWPYVGVIVGVFFDWLHQKMFNRLRLVRRERMEILRVIKEETFKDRNFHVACTGIIGILHSNRSWFHPQREELLSYYEMLLMSLADTGDLIIEEGISFKLAPKGFATLAEYEREEQKYEENSRMQKWMVRLTFILAFVGVCQVVSALMQISCKDSPSAFICFGHTFLGK
jgi:hypothetical protein